MSNKKRVVITELGNIFGLPRYFDIPDREKEIASMQFMLSFQNATFVDKNIPLLASLLSLGKLKLHLVDGWEEPVFFKARIMMAQLVKVILPETTSDKLLKSTMFYYRASHDIDLVNKFIEITDLAESEGQEVINLRDRSWTEYVEGEFPEMFESQPDVFKSKH